MSRTDAEQANLDLVLAMYRDVLMPMDSARVDDYIAPGYIQHSSLAAPTVQALKDFLDFVKVQSPEGTHNLKRAFVDGDHVIVHHHVIRHAAYECITLRNNGNHFAFSSFNFLDVRNDFFVISIFGGDE